MTRSKVEMIGKVFGRLTVIAETDKRMGSNIIWRCQCSCGKIVDIAGYNIRVGNSKSCGCYKNEVSSERWKLKEGNSSLNKKYIEYKNSAMLRKLEFTLSLLEFEKLTSEACYYCGLPPSNTTNYKYHSKAYTYNGIDRVDNYKGYTVDNVVSCCWSCNNGKKNNTTEEFLLWIKKVYEFNKLEVYRE